MKTGPIYPMSPVGRNLENGRFGQNASPVRISHQKAGVGIPMAPRGPKLKIRNRLAHNTTPTTIPISGKEPIDLGPPEGPKLKSKDRRGLLTEPTKIPPSGKRGPIDTMVPGCPMLRYKGPMRPEHRTGRNTALRKTGPIDRHVARRP